MALTLVATGPSIGLEAENASICRCGRLAGGLGSHLLAEKVEAIGMAEVLPGVEHLEEAIEEPRWRWSVPCSHYLCPSRPRLENQP
jgi:hypothetical protein